MSATEITNAQYVAYLNEVIASGYVTVLEKDVKGVGGIYTGQSYLYMDYSYDSNNRCWISYNNDTFSVTSGKENLPVEGVTWYGAKAFALYYVFDLPTEAEWEYAASGGKQYQYGTDDGTISGSKANYNYTIGHPVDVGSYPPNPFGLYDMSGNVWEWCDDWYDSDYYNSSPAHNPIGAQKGSSRVVRGGCWLSSADLCRAANRSHNYPVHGYYFGGFGLRVVRRLSN
jgi:formylglycine-generating enzyme required for sulfatase activity